MRGHLQHHACPPTHLLTHPHTLSMQAQGKDVRALRSLYYLAEVYVSPGSAGTPTLYDPALGALPFWCMSCVLC